MSTEKVQREQEGVALVTALLVTALASVMAASLVSRQQLDIRRTGNVLEGDRAYVLALGVESWVKYLLVRDSRESQKDSLDETWAMTLPPLSVEGGQVAGRIEDLQGRFNINNLVDEEGKVNQSGKRQFEQLLDGLGIERGLVNGIVDWIDKDANTTFPGGAEDDVYLSADPPYRTANTPLVSPSELLLVKGVTREIYQTLAPHIAALPEPNTPINVNTATAPVLSSLSAGLTMGDAEALIEERGEEGFDNINDFLGSAVLQNRANDIGQERISVKTGYFLMEAATRFGSRGKAQLYSVLARDGGKVTVVMRAQGAY